MDDKICDVAVDEHVAGKQADAGKGVMRLSEHPIQRNFGRLYLGKFLEKSRIFGL